MHTLLSFVPSFLIRYIHFACVMGIHWKFLQALSKQPSGLSFNTKQLLRATLNKNPRSAPSKFRRDSTNKSSPENTGYAVLTSGNNHETLHVLPWKTSPSISMGKVLWTATKPDPFKEATGTRVIVNFRENAVRDA